MAEQWGDVTAGKAAAGDQHSATRFTHRPILAAAMPNSQSLGQVEAVTGSGYKLTSLIPSISFPYS